MMIFPYRLLTPCQLAEPKPSLESATHQEWVFISARAQSRDPRQKALHLVPQHLFNTFLLAMLGPIAFLVGAQVRPMWLVLELHIRSERL
jgi:hypothetical protein